jgi:hypothetical protein
VKGCSSDHAGAASHNGAREPASASVLKAMLSHALTARVVNPGSDKVLGKLLAMHGAVH